MKNRIFLFLASLMILCSFSGCVHLDEKEIPADAPTVLHSPASELFGKTPDTVIVKTENAIAKIPLTTQLIRDVAKQSRQAVVSIYAETKTPYRIRLIPIRIPGMGFRVHIPGAALGTGFFIHPSGYILTNNHVIQQALKIKVMTFDNVDHDVIVVARDPVYDLALLKVINVNKKFPILAMGNSKKADSGDMVIAVGNPLGLGHTVTSGIISHMGRDLSGVPENEAKQVEFIQTDAAINPGSSGGPLITMTGAWIGVNTAGTLQSEGIGFAVPSSHVVEFISDILSGNGEKAEILKK